LRSLFFPFLLPSKNQENDGVTPLSSFAAFSPPLPPLRTSETYRVRKWTMTRPKNLGVSCPPTGPCPGCFPPRSVNFPPSGILHFSYIPPDIFQTMSGRAVPSMRLPIAINRGPVRTSPATLMRSATDPLSPPFDLRRLFLNQIRRFFSYVLLRTQRFRNFSLGIGLPFSSPLIS